MVKGLDKLFARKGAEAVLRAYGLDQVLTEQDDAQLWASALVRHWPAPDDPEMDPAALRFGVGRIVPEDEREGTSLAQSGMEQVEVWCFERADEGRLRVVACVNRPMVSFMTALASGGLPAAGGTWVTDRIDISRPSRGEKRSLVHRGVSMPPNAGNGETRYWERGEEGRWAETQEVFSRWLA